VGVASFLLEQIGPPAYRDLETNLLKEYALLAYMHKQRATDQIRNHTFIPPCNEFFQLQ
jgi:hypothetical protein